MKALGLITVDTLKTLVLHVNLVSLRWSTEKHTITTVWHRINAYLEQCQEGGIRLEGGQFPHEGRVEVCLNEVWGTVCHDAWNNQDAQVACRQLGFVPQGTQVELASLYCVTYSIYSP